MLFSGAHTFFILQKQVVQEQQPRGWSAEHEDLLASQLLTSKPLKQVECTF